MLYEVITDALAKFLSTRKFVFNDITLANRKIINEIGLIWSENEQIDYDNQLKELERIMLV